MYFVIPNYGKVIMTVSTILILIFDRYGNKVDSFPRGNVIYSNHLLLNN